ncbi:MAG: radical SAM protein [Deltaproteobacteria bacterium]|nr:radical SAM protein [Deltaproteobacteria bacterium]
MAKLPYTKYDLDSYFEKYSDVNKEVIIKEDLLRLGVSFTSRALEESAKYATKSYYLFSYDAMDVDDMKDKEYVRAPECFKFKGGPYNLRVSNNKTCMDKPENTPYRVDFVDEKLQLSWEGNYLADVELRPKPPYYSYTLPDGTPYSDVAASVFWGYLTFCTILRSCQYWGEKEECVFCDINTNARKQSKTGRPYMIQKSVEDVVTVLDVIFNKEREPINHAIIMTGGALYRGTKQLRGKDNVQFYAQYARAIREKIGNRWAIHQQTTALTKTECKILKDAGVDCHHANIEVWDKDLFKVMCPGKEEKIGRDEWIKRVCDSVDVFGEGCVVPTFVSGCELAKPWGFEKWGDAVKSMKEAWEFLMSHGVTPRSSSWVIEPNSVLGRYDQPPIPLEYYIEVDIAWYETWKKYNLPPIYNFTPMGPGRCLGINSGHLDMGS